MQMNCSVFQEKSQMVEMWSAPALSLGELQSAEQKPQEHPSFLKP